MYRENAYGLDSGGLCVLIILIADIWAIVHVLGSSSSVGTKVAWTVVILLLLVIGFIAWSLFNPRGSRLASARNRSTRVMKSSR